MIRQFVESDLQAVIAMVQKDREMTDKEIADRLTGNQAWVWDDGEVLGCSAVGKVREAAGVKIVSAWVFTDIEHRGKGIGGELWKVAMEHVKGLCVDRVHTSYRTDRGTDGAWFARRQFAQWFTIHLMKYEGPEFADPGLKTVPYSDELFHDYIRLTNDGFRGLRRQLSIEPNDSYPVGFNEAEAREALLKDRENIFFIEEDGKICGYTLLSDRYIDTLTVDAACSGRGLGKRLTQLSVNLLRERGVKAVYLGVLAINTRAQKIYEGLGFEYIETTDLARSKVENLS